MKRCPVQLVLILAGMAPLFTALAQIEVPRTQPRWIPDSADLSGGTLQTRLAAQPGGYQIESATNLAGTWIGETNVIVDITGAAGMDVPVDGRPALFLRARSRDVMTLLSGGGVFSPQVFCDGDAPAEFLWNWSDGTSDASRPVAEKDFGSAGLRFQRLTASPSGAITGINLGYDGADGGAAPLPYRSPQNVSAVWFPAPLPHLVSWASSYNPITNTLDFSGFNALEYIECFNCSPMRHVVVTNLPALQRVCFEDCDLQEIDLSGNPNLGDVRGAMNAFTNFVVGRGTGPRIWHWCTRDNPQLRQDFSEFMTNFFSLRELYIWNDNQHGALTTGSTNLQDVQVSGNAFTHADMTGQSNLWTLGISRNHLTNLIVTGCTGLQYLDARGNALPSEVLDTLLATLDAGAPALRQVDLTENAGMVSPGSFVHCTNLMNRGVNVLIDWPDTSDGSNNITGGTNAITFVTSSRQPNMEIRLQGPVTSILWHWGDGTITPNALIASHEFAGPAIHTNYVEVVPPEAVTYFGAQGGYTGQGIRAVYGATNFPSLNFLYLYQESLVDLCLAGCASLRQLHLAENPVPVAVCDQWFIDLDAAVPGPVSGADFFYPSASRSSASDAAWTSLVNKGYAMHPY